MGRAKVSQDDFRAEVEVEFISVMPTKLIFESVPRRLAPLDPIDSPWDMKACPIVIWVRGIKSSWDMEACPIVIWKVIC